MKLSNHIERSLIAIGKSVRALGLQAATALVAVALTACGGGGSSGTEPVTPPPAGPVTGGVFSAGNFVVTVADNSIPTAVNAAPVATADSAIPSSVIVSSYETNVTAGAKAYTLTVGGASFDTGSSGSVRMEVPFDRNLVPDKTKIDSLHLLLRVFNPDDNSVVSLTGQLVGDKVVADLTGFPASATVTVLFNPNMDVAANDIVTPAVNSSRRLAAASNSTWETRNWAVVYDAAVIASEVQTFLGSNAAPSADQIRLVVKQQIANHASDAAATYQGEGFRSPTLYVAKTAAEAGGAIFGTNPRYLLHFQNQESSHFTPQDPTEVIGPDHNHFGRLYIQGSHLNKKYATDGYSVYGVIAHELLHAVQAGYGLPIAASFKGLKEGSATAYGEFLDRRHNVDPSATPHVRQISNFPNQINVETFKLEDYLLGGGSFAYYSNQDFFVYLARTKGNNNYKFLATLFEQSQLTIADEANKQGNPAAVANFIANPSHYAVLKGFDLFLSGIYSSTLSETYEDFARQRAIEHNVDSQMGRPGETVDGLAINLFNSYPANPGMKDVLIDTESAQTTTVNDLSPIDQLSSSVIRIRPVPGKTGANITINLAPSKGAFGTTVVGWMYRKPSASAGRTAVVLQTANVVAGFGADSADEIVIVLVNPSYEIGAVGINCSIAVTPAAISVSPSSVNLNAGATQLFSANVANTEITWSVQEGAAGGTISADGLYTAPANSGTYHVIATSKADSSNKASATITVTAVTNPVTLSGTFPSVEKPDAALHTVVGGGTWTMTGTGIELLSSDASHAYIYAPIGSQGKLTINGNVVWGYAPAERVHGDFRYVDTYKAVEIYPGYLGDGSGIVSQSIIGQTMIIDYLMATEYSRFVLTPQFVAQFDENIYFVSDGTWLESSHGGWTFDFFSVTVVPYKY